VTAIVCDAGHLLAVLNERDKLHGTCVSFFGEFTGDLIACESDHHGAERLGITRLASIDNLHMRAVKPAHCDAFELLPD
jgi:hypothetical protein